MLNKDKTLKPGVTSFDKEGSTSPNCKKNDALLKEIPLEFLKDYCGDVPKKKEGEGEKKEPIKDLKCGKKSAHREVRKREKEETATDEEADVEKSGNEDSSPKPKKKKRLKQRKATTNENKGKVLNLKDAI